jgi:hypothetical protein
MTNLIGAGQIKRHGKRPKRRRPKPAPGLLKLPRPYVDRVLRRAAKREA